MKKIITAISAAMLLLLSACATGPVDPTPTATTDLAPELSQYVKDNLPEDISASIGAVTAIANKDAVDITIRVIYAKGALFADAAEAVVPVILDGYAESGATIGTIQVIERIESNDQGAHDNSMISWRSSDGETGTFVNDQGEESVLKTKLALGDIRDYINP